MIDADELINAIGDDGLKQVVASVVGDAGVEITSDMLTTLVEAVKQGIRDAWAAREAERAAECRRKNVGYAAGGCVAGGP